MPRYEANQAARFFVVRFTVALDRRLQEPIAEKMTRQYSGSRATVFP